MAEDDTRLGSTTTKGFCCPVVMGLQHFTAKQLPVGLSMARDPRPFLEAEWDPFIELQVPFPHRVDIDEALAGVDLTVRSEPRHLTAAEEAALGPTIRVAAPWL